MDRVELIIYMRTLTKKILKRGLFQRKGTKRGPHLQKGSPRGPGSPLGDPSTDSESNYALRLKYSGFGSKCKNVTSIQIHYI